MIAFTPIDLPCKIPNRRKLTDYVLDNAITNLEYTSTLCMVASRNPINDWTDANEVFPESDKNYDLRENHNVFYAPGFAESFPELVDVLKLLPYKQLIGAALNLHTDVLPPHRDDVDITGPMSPERYNILLTPHYNKKSFFISKEEHGEKVYPLIPENAPVYAFNNKDIWHGADIILDHRIILVCAGILDTEQHEFLINKSVEKFENDGYVIRF